MKRENRRIIKQVVLEALAATVITIVLFIMCFYQLVVEDNLAKEAKAENTFEIVMETPIPAPNVTTEVEPEPVEPVEPEIVIDENEAILIAKTLWGECRGCSTVEQAAVAWCILNRVDADGYAMGNSVEYVVTFTNQFLGYNENHPVTDELYALAVDVLTRWELEKQGEEDVGRVLPKEFKWFAGDGLHNHFRDKYQNGTRWDWSLPDPYTEGAK